MRRVFGIVLCTALGIPAPAAAQAISVTVNGNPSIPPIVSWDDYAKRTFGDPWDMNERTDIGFLTWGIDQPANGMTGKVVQNGRFRGTPINQDPNFFLLDSWFNGASKIGKNGGQFPVDLSRYTMLVLKMKMATTVLNQAGSVDGVPTATFASLASPGGPPRVPVMEVVWSRQSIAHNPSSQPLGGSIGLGFQTAAPGNPWVPIGISFSPTSPEEFNLAQINGRAYSAMGKSMEGGRYVMHTLPLNDLASTTPYYSLRTRTDAHGWRNFGGAAINESWSGLADSLRIDPINVANLGEIDLDFARLLAPDPANSTPVVVNWSSLPYSRYDVIVSSDPSCDDDAGTPGEQYTVVAYSQQTGFPFLPQTLPQGTYYVGLRDQMCGVVGQFGEEYCDREFVGLQSSEVRVCSATPIHVVDAPTLTFTSPRPEGSTDDYATTQLGNPWDFLSLNDVDHSAGLTGGKVQLIPAERPSGLSLGNYQVYSATSIAVVPPATNFGDPIVSTLFFTKRGAWNRIDAQRYRLLTLDVGTDKARDLNLGSIARVVWHVAGEGGTNPVSGQFAPLQNVSAEMLLRHMAKGSTTVDTTSARHVIDRFQADLMDHVMLPLESSANGSQSRSGWRTDCQLAAGSQSPTTGLGGGSVSSCAATPTSDPFGLPRAGIDAFRVDPHEFRPATMFHIGGIKLAAHERIGGSFVIQWSTANTNPGSTPHATNSNWTVRLYAVPVSPSSPMTPVSRTCSAATSGVITETPLSAGSANWINGGFVAPPSSGTIAAGALVFVCAGLIPPGGSAPLEFVLSQWPVVYDTGVQSMGPRLFLDKATLRFTAIRNAQTLTAITPAQTVTVSQVGSGSVPWTVDVRDTNGNTVDYVQIAPASGVGPGTFTVRVVPSDSLPHGFSGLSADIGLVIRLVATSAENSPQYVNMTLALYREGTITTARAFGQVNSPTHYTGSATNNDNGPCAAAAGTPSLADDCVTGSVAVTGWALDDIGVNAIKIFRQCRPQELLLATCKIPDGSGHDTRLVFVGDASFISGARPDVEAAFSTYPNAHRAGWGFLVLTNQLPDLETGTVAGGQGLFDFSIFAIDAEGGFTLLGRTTNTNVPTRIYANNKAATTPFGSIDTPQAGGTAAGTYNNFGWVLTPNGGTNAEMAINGSGITVFVDGAAMGSPTYNLCRGSVAVNGVVPPGQFCNDDISTKFANRGYLNLTAGRGAVGVLTFNTTPLVNGLHTIAWGVSDSLGRSTGIGSRFFTVLNSSGGDMGDPTAAFGIPTGQEVGMHTDDLRWLAQAPGVPQMRTGYSTAEAFSYPQMDRPIDAKEMGRLELALPMPMSEAAWDGYLVRGGRLLPLPPGTSLNPSTGQFAWQSAPGWIGTHELLFVRQNANGTRERLPVSVSFGTISVTPGDGAARR